MIEIDSIKEFYEIVDNSDTIIVYFYTTWCPDCLIIKPFINVLETEFKDVLFYSFNRDKSIELAKHLNIYGVPSFIIYKNGDEITRLVNKNRKSYQEVREFILESIN